MKKFALLFILVAGASCALPPAPTQEVVEPPPAPIIQPTAITAEMAADDVLDEADTRRGGDSVHKLYSNKVAVIVGDYLLARASGEGK